MGITRDVGSSPLSPSDTELRKRASKACERCKLKKVKCCGSKPCSRCQSDDAVCYFGTANRFDVKPVSAARANQLEHQQALLVKALRLLWRRWYELDSSENTATLDENASVHDIVESLGLLNGSLDPILVQNGLEFEETESIATNSSENTLNLDNTKDHGVGFQENEDMILMDYSTEESAQYQQMDHGFQEETFSDTIDPDIFQLDDLSQFDGFYLEQPSLQAVHAITATIANRRGYGNMPSLGPLPDFNTSNGQDQLQQGTLDPRTADVLMEYTTLTPV